MLFLLRNPSVAAGILGVEEGKSQKGPAVWPPTVTRRPRTPKIKFRAEEAMEDDLGNSEVLKEIQSPKPPQSLKRQRENAIEEDLRGTRRRKASVQSALKTITNIMRASRDLQATESELQDMQ